MIKAAPTEKRSIGRVGGGEMERWRVLRVEVREASLLMEGSVGAQVRERCGKRNPAFPSKIYTKRLDFLQEVRENCHHNRSESSSACGRGTGGVTHYRRCMLEGRSARPSWRILIAHHFVRMRRSMATRLLFSETVEGVLCLFLQGACELVFGSWE